MFIVNAVDRSSSGKELEFIYSAHLECSMFFRNLQTLRTIANRTPYCQMTDNFDRRPCTACMQSKSGNRQKITLLPTVACTKAGCQIVYDIRCLKRSNKASISYDTDSCLLTFQCKHHQKVTLDADSQSNCIDLTLEDDSADWRSAVAARIVHFGMIDQRFAIYSQHKFQVYKEFQKVASIDQVE